MPKNVAWQWRDMTGLENAEGETAQAFCELSLPVFFETPSKLQTRILAWIP